MSDGRPHPGMEQRRCRPAGGFSQCIEAGTPVPAALVTDSTARWRMVGAEIGGPVVERFRPDVVPNLPTHRNSFPSGDRSEAGRGCSASASIQQRSRGWRSAAGWQGSCWRRMAVSFHPAPADQLPVADAEEPPVAPGGGSGEPPCPGENKLGQLLGGAKTVASIATEPPGNLRVSRASSSSCEEHAERSRR